MSQNQLRGKTAVVTGGTRGIGRAISLNLAVQGAKVFALYARNRKAADLFEAEAQEKKLDIHCVRGDLSDSSVLQQSADMILGQSETVDIIVHSAASGV